MLTLHATKYFFKGINSELESLNKHKKHAEHNIVDLKRLLEETKGTFTSQHQKVVDMTYYLKSFKADFKELMTYIQEPSTLKVSRGVALAIGASPGLKKKLTQSCYKCF
jgi:peptidoglycan hydrolase CwlO-like protein